MPHPHPARAALALALALPAAAQIPAEGIVWEADAPARKIHLCNEHGKHMMFDWSARQDLHTSAGHCASYAYDAATDTETFRLVGRNSNRAEIRLINEYEQGARQFEGYVTIHGPLDDLSLMQIWGSAEGATQLMLRGYADDGGTLAVNCGSALRVKLLTGAFGREIKVNIVHLQENVGNRIRVYLDDRLVGDFPDDEKAVNNFNANYHKYGVYGKIADRQADAVVSWRRVRHFRDAGGVRADKATPVLDFPALPATQVGAAGFDAGARLSTGRTLRYRSSDPSVADVSESGRIQPVAPGTALILAFHEGDATHHPVSVVRELRVEPAPGRTP